MLLSRLSRLFTPATRRPVPAQLLVSPLEERATPAASTFSINANTVDEGGAIVFTIRHDGLSINDGSGGSGGRIHYDIGGGTALPFYNYIPPAVASGDIQLAAGQSFTVIVQTNDNDHFEGDKTLIGRISNPVGGVLTHSQTAAIIHNTDPPPAPAIISVEGPGTVGEGQDNAFAVTRAGNASTAVSVSYLIEQRSARVGTDYFARSYLGQIDFAENDTSAHLIPFDTINNDIHDGLRSFEMSIFLPTGGAKVGTSKAVVVINDDDPVPTLVVEKSFVGLAEGKSGVISVSLSNPTIYTTSVTFTKHGLATSKWGTDVTLTGSEGTIVFQPRTMGPVPITVTALADRIPEDSENFQLIFRPGPNIATGNRQVQFEVTDTTRPSVWIAAALNVYEGDRNHNVEFTIRTDAVIENVPLKVNFRYVDSGAVIGTDYQPVNNATITFGPGQQSAPVAVTIKSNRIRNPSARNFMLELVGDPAYVLGFNPAALCRILDDD